MGPRNGVPATRASRGAPRGDDIGLCDGEPGSRIAKKNAPAEAGATWHVVTMRPQSRRLGASGTFFQWVRLSAMILVDCNAAWLKVAYSTISRCTRAASL